MNDFTTTFFSWLDRQGLKPKDVAEQLGINTQTVSNWRSAGVPKGKQFACQALMDKAAASQQEELNDLRNTLVMHPTHAQFTAWNKAALRNGQTIEDWAFEGLERLAEEFFTYPDDTADNITTLRVADEPAYRCELEYLGAAAAGSGVTSDHLGTVLLRNQYPAHYKAIKIIGDSMDDGSEIAIADGCIAIVNPQWDGKPFALKNKIYSWSIDGGQVLKKFVRRKVDGKTRGYLESLNPAFAPIPYTDDMIPQGEFVAVECPNS